MFLEHLLFGLFLIIQVSACPPGCNCKQQGEIDCRNRNLNRFPSFNSFPNNVSKVYLQNNKIKSITLHGIYHIKLSKVTVMIMDRNFLTVIPYQSIFSLLPGLNALHLQQNRIHTIERQAFSPLTSLQELHLQENNLQDLQEGYFTGLVALKRLYLSSNKIGNIKLKSFQGLRKLEGLYLHKNRIKVIPEHSFKEFKSLKELSLSENKITYLSARSFGGLINLSKLTLSKNVFDKFQEILFSDLLQMEFFYLDTNRITMLKNEAFSLFVDLKCLDLYNNGIKTIQKKAFVNLRKLESLDLSHNQLTIIEHEWLQSLTSLKYLYLNHNNILDFEPREFAWPGSLNEIWVQDNDILKCTILVQTSKLSRITDAKPNTTIFLHGNTVFCECKQSEHEENILEFLGLTIYLCCRKREMFCNTGEGDWQREEFAHFLTPWPRSSKTWKKWNFSLSVNISSFLSAYLTRPVCRKPQITKPVIRPDSVECIAEGEPRPTTNLTIRLTKKEKQAAMIFNCTASNIFGSVHKIESLIQEAQYYKIDCLTQEAQYWHKRIMFLMSACLSSLSVLVLMFVIFLRYCIQNRCKWIFK